MTRTSLSGTRFGRPDPRTEAVTYAGVALLTSLALAACGSGVSGSTGAPAAGSTPARTATTEGTGGGQNGQQRQPGVRGLVAAVSGSTMQVQTRSDQTAVSWTDSTTFATFASAALSDVTVGSCVTVTQPAASGGQEAASATAVTAATVQVRPAANGTCTGGFGGVFGGGFGGAPTGRPTDRPTGTGVPGAAAGSRGGGAVGGLVTAVDGGTITIHETARRTAGGAASSASSTGSSTATAAPTATSADPGSTVTVTTTSTTTYVLEKTAAAADVAVGECATASGKTDDTGAVTATAITLRPATNGSCTGARGGPTGTATRGTTATGSGSGG